MPSNVQRIALPGPSLYLQPTAIKTVYIWGAFHELSCGNHNLKDGWADRLTDSLLFTYLSRWKYGLPLPT